MRATNIKIISLGSRLGPLWEMQARRHEREGRGFPVAEKELFLRLFLVFQNISGCMLMCLLCESIRITMYFQVSLICGWKELPIAQQVSWQITSLP